MLKKSPDHGAPAIAERSSTRLPKGMRRAMGLAVLALAAAQPMATSAQTFPNKPVRIIIGFPGGSTDVSARLFAGDMTRTLGQVVNVEAMPGAGGTIAANAVVRANPDGYTIFYGAVTGISPIFQKNNAVNAGQSLAPVSLLMSTPFVFYSSGKLPVKTLSELVAWTKANPGKLNHGSVGVANLLLGVALKARTGMDFVDVPYKSTSDMKLALIAGDVGIAPNTPTGWTPTVKSGAVHPLLVLSAKRFPLFPDTPTAEELGIRDLTIKANFSLWAPLGTPKAVIDALSRAAVAAAHNPEVAEKIRGEAIGGEPEGTPPEELAKSFSDEYRLWTEFARSANYTPQ